MKTACRVCGEWLIFVLKAQARSVASRVATAREDGNLPARLCG